MMNINNYFFQNAVTSKYVNYKDPLTGKKLNLRPHWAKEFPSNVGKGNAGFKKIFLKQAFGKRLPKFFTDLKKVISLNHGNFNDSMKRFSTKYLDELFHDYYT